MFQKDGYTTYSSMIDSPLAETSSNSKESLSDSPLLNIMDTMDSSSSEMTKDPDRSIYPTSTKAIEKCYETIPIHSRAMDMPSNVESSKMPPFSIFTLPANIIAKNNKLSLPAFEYITPNGHNSTPTLTEHPLLELNRVGIFPQFVHRRPRGEKRPIPDEQKDQKYYERRKRNNEAAKKSRDARKIREDRIAFRAALLEQENSFLRTQILALRGELHTLRQVIGTVQTSAHNTERTIGAI